jgi:hypothetical protein
MVVPLSCLSNIEGNKADVFLIDLRQGLFGVETFIKTVSVAILEHNNTYAAISTDLIIPGSMLVSHSTKPLESGKTVSVSQSYAY